MNIIDEENKEFYEKLATDLLTPTPMEEQGLCIFCNSEICDAGIYTRILKCYNCDSHFHEYHVGKYAFEHNIGLPHIFRCPKCDVLLKMDEHSCLVINDIPIEQEPLEFGFESADEATQPGACGICTSISDTERGNVEAGCERPGRVCTGHPGKGSPDNATCRCKAVPESAEQGRKCREARESGQQAQCPKGIPGWYDSGRLTTDPHDPGNGASRSRTHGYGSQEIEGWEEQPRSESGRHGEELAYTPGTQPQDPWKGVSGTGWMPIGPDCGGWWSAEPNVGRVAHGVSARVDRLKCLGNAIVPHCAALIMLKIKDAMDQGNA